MPQLKICKYCGGKPTYHYLSHTANMTRVIENMQSGAPLREHKISCSGCDYETKLYDLSVGAVKEWNQKKER